MSLQMQLSELCGRSSILYFIDSVFVAASAMGAAATAASGATAASVASTAGTMVAGAGALAGTYGTAAAVVGGAAGAFAGSLASQGVGSAMGQTSFSWSNVAASTIAGAATAGFGTLVSGAPAVVAAVGTAAVGNVSSYVANKLVGNEASFSWKSVAASAVTAGITQQLAPTISSALGIDAGSYARDIVSGITGGVVSAHVRQGMVGGAVNYQDVFVDAFGNVLSSSLNRRGLASLAQADQRRTNFTQWDAEDAASRQQMIADEEAGMVQQQGWNGDQGGMFSLPNDARTLPNVILGSGLSADERARLATTTTYHTEYVDPYLIGKNGGATERTDVTQSFWVRNNSPVSVELLPEEVARPVAARVETLSWDDELAYRVVGGSYGVLRSVAEGVIGMGMLAKSFAGAGMYQTGLSAQLGLVDAHAADAEVVGRTVATMVDFVRHPIDTTVKYVNNSLAAADRLEASGDLLGASAERSSMVFNIGTAAVDGYGLVRAAAPVAGRVAGRLLSDVGDSMMGAGSLRSQIGAVGDVSKVRPLAAQSSNTVVTRTVGKNTAHYVLDAEGNTLSVKFSLREDFGGGARSSAEVQAQSESASQGISGDQGGHLLGYRFMPEQGRINLFPQNGNFNISPFKTLENDYARYIGEGYQVDGIHALGDITHKSVN
ncbi:DNA/RNA non-specific endonuclease [Xanthomonas oryzae]|uniref:DNA/RNA non-specific endonuclease n=1 Tax=Xanthomonas oryzae TaxID=347 RepID=UPI0010336568|nr:DNA/RNA non-specific endonuclease [Xanthomonas oryzae]QBH01556.1 hypothetical protein EYC56_22840 [Xanthomonas oryzae]